YLLARGRKAEAAEHFRVAAAALEDQPRKSGGDLDNLACARALAAAAIGAVPGGPTAEDRRGRDRLIAAAMDALRQGIEKASATAAQMRANEDLAILRDRADFRALIACQQAAEEAAALTARAGSGTSEARLKAGQAAVAAHAKLAGEEPRSRRHRADLAA